MGKIECYSCLNKIQDQKKHIVDFACGHFLCITCYEKWVFEYGKTTCPLCRNAIVLNRPYFNFMGRPVSVVLSDTEERIFYKHLPFWLSRTSADIIFDDPYHTIRFIASVTKRYRVIINLTLEGVVARSKVAFGPCHGDGLGRVSDLISTESKDEDLGHNSEISFISVAGVVNLYHGSSYGVRVEAISKDSKKVSLKEGRIEFLPIN